jgi:hypothetical protein
MAGCRIVNAAVESAVSNIKTISTTYKTNGENFIQSLNSAIAEMEGETKDALDTFINKTVKEFVETSVPGAVDGMSQLLEANRTNFVDVDKQIADSISAS